MTWLQALKKWNARMNQENEHHRFCIPRKGTDAYNQVKELMGKESNKRVKKTKKKSRPAGRARGKKRARDEQA